MPTDPAEDDLLDMKALRAGDELALNRIMARHREKLFHYLIRLVQNESEALDLAEEAFVRVFLNREKFNSKLRFSTWLYAIATNLARDRLRWFSRHRNVSLDAATAEDERPLVDSLAEAKPQPHEQLQTEERLTEIRTALAQIPEDLRTPLILAEYENLSHLEIAQILKCTAKAVETRIYRARQQLREKLKHLLVDA